MKPADIVCDFLEGPLTAQGHELKALIKALPAAQGYDQGYDQGNGLLQGHDLPAAQGLFCGKATTKALPAAAAKPCATLPPSPL